MKNPANEQKIALAAFSAARELYQKRQFAEAQGRMGEYQRLIGHRRFPMTDQRQEQKPSCSIIIVIYNTSADVLACIDRLLSQAIGEKAEIIVVDNGGNEALHEKLLARPVLHIRCPYNFLPSEGRNIGAFFAKAPRLLFVDDDGLPEEGYIAQAIKALVRPDTIGVRGRIVPLNPGGRAGPHYDLGNEVKENASFNLEGNMAIKHSVFKAAGGFDPLMFGHEGNELAERCQRTTPNGKIRYWPALVLKHDFADGKQLASKRQRQALGEAYRAWLSKTSTSGAVSPPSVLQKGITLVLRIGPTTELPALQDYLENLAAQNGQFRKEVLLLHEKAPGVSREQLMGIVRKFAGRLTCVVIPGGYWQKSVLASRARYSFLLLADALPAVNAAELTNAVTLMGEEVAPWLQISGTDKSAIFLVTRAAYLDACGFSTSDETDGSPKNVKEFVEKAGLPRSEAHKQLKKRMLSRQTQQLTEDRLQLPSKFSNEVKEFSNQIIHTTPYFRDENLEPWRHTPKTNVCIAFIGSGALYKSLRSACHVTHLTPLLGVDEPQASNVLSNCDLLLVESRLLSAHQQAYANACTAWAEKFRQAGKPSAFWYTESLAHLPLLEHLALHFDHVYATQPETTRCLGRYLQKHKQTSASVQQLEPCIAPELNNAIRQFKMPTFDNLHVLYDGWADLIEFEDNRSLLRSIKREDLLIADSCWQFNQRKLKDFPEFSPQILGYFVPQQRRQALKEFNAVLITSRTLKPGERLQQEIAEALAAKCLVILFIHPGDDIQAGVFGDLVEYHTSAKELGERLQWLKDNPWHCMGLVQPGWRNIHQNHSVQQRIDRLLEQAGSTKRVTETPLVSYLTVTKRPQYIEKIIENYQRQQYPNKELLVALNSAEVDIQAVKAHVHKSVPSARVYQLDADRNIGFCLNWLIQQATGDYWAKMDDDDEYGQHYLQDYVLNVRALDIDVMGKKMGPTYFEALGQTLYRDPASMSASDFLLHEDNRHHMAGATFFGKSDLLKRNPFSEALRSSVDVEFFRSALKKSLNVMLADDFNFTVFRAADKSHHTWKEDDGALLKTALPVSRKEINV